MDAKTHDEKVRAARIESLKHTPAWDELASVLQQQEDKFWTRHISDLKNGDALDQRSWIGRSENLTGYARFSAPPARPHQSWSG
jgi:hypothetical protein